MDAKALPLAMRTKTNDMRSKLNQSDFNGFHNDYMQMIQMLDQLMNSGMMSDQPKHAVLRFNPVLSMLMQSYQQEDYLTVVDLLTHQLLPLIDPRTVQQTEGRM